MNSRIVNNFFALFLWLTLFVKNSLIDPCKLNFFMNSYCAVSNIPPVVLAVRNALKIIKSISSPGSPLNPNNGAVIPK